MLCSSLSAQTGPEYFQQAMEASEKKNFESQAQLLEKAIAAGVDHPFAFYSLAKAYSLTGKEDQAFLWLNKTANLGVHYNINEDTAFESLKKSPRWMLALEKLEANLTPAGNSRPFATISKDSVPEGITYDAVGQKFYFGSIAQSKIVSYHNGTFEEFSKPDDGLPNVLGMSIDTKRRMLWAAGSALIGPAKGRAALFQYDLSNRKLHRTFRLPGTDHVLGDVIVDSKGNAYATDSSSPAVYVVRDGQNEIEQLVGPGSFRSPQGLCLSRDESILYVADYSRGIFAVETPAGEVSRLQRPEGSTTLAGIDGLYRHENSLMAIQNGIQPNRILRIFLSADGKQITSIETLESNHPIFPEPTLGVVVENTFYYIANSSIGKYLENPESELTETQILQLPLSTEADRNDRSKWLKENVLKINSIDPSVEDDTDLMPLIPLIGSSRIVQLGEATHGDGSAFMAKTHLIRFLHKVMGFNAIAWEAGFFDLHDVSAGLSGTGPLVESASLGLYQMWAESVEVQPVLEYIRASQSSARPIKLAGFDSRVSTDSARKERYPQFLFSFFDRLDPTIISQKEREDLTRMSAGLVPYEYYKSPGERNYNRELPRRLVSVIDTRHTEFSRFYRSSEIAFARQTIVSMMNMDRALPADPYKGGPEGYSRDAAMAENLIWLLNGPFRNDRVIVWAHNYHIQMSILDPSKLTVERKYAGPTGLFLKKEFGNDLYTIAFIGHHGEYGFAGEDAESLPQTKSDSLENLLHRLNRPYLFLDFRHAPEDHWLRKPLTASFYLYDPWTTDWPRLYDAVFFIDKMERSHLVPK